MIGFFKKLLALLTPCNHKWRFIKMTRMNELGNHENNEILSSREYSLQRCKVCGKEKYRRL